MWLGQMFLVRISVRSAFGLALVLYLSIRRVGDLGGRIVTSYTGVVPGYAGSFGYDNAPRYCRGRRQVVTARLVCYDGIAVVSVVPHVRVWCRSSERCNGSGCTPVRDILPDI
jgi:hypothetical protein